MESHKLEKSEFVIMLTNALKEAIDPRDLPSDPKELKQLARQVVNECMMLKELEKNNIE